MYAQQSFFPPPCPTYSLYGQPAGIFAYPPPAMREHAQRQFHTGRVFLPTGANVQEEGGEMASAARGRGVTPQALPAEQYRYNMQHIVPPPKALMVPTQVNSRNKLIHIR